MAATNTPPPPSTGNNKSSMSTLAQQLLHKPAFKKLAVIILTFIPAFIGLSIINVIFTHAFVLSSYLFGTTTTTPTVIGGDSGNVAAIPKRAKEQGNKKQVKTVYVTPTQQDLENILIELESSEPLPNSGNNIINNGESSVNRVKSAIASLQSLTEQKTNRDVTALKDMDELTEAYESFVTRFEEDIAHYHANEGETEVQLEYLPQFMKRKSLLDLDRGAMEDLFEDVMADLNVLLKDDVILRNPNQALMKLLSSNESSGNVESSCDAIFLDLDKGKPTPELEAVVAPKKTATAAAVHKPVITEDTARESDLYERIDSIKEILSRRELSGDKNPIDDEGVAGIRSQVAAVVSTLLENRKAALDASKGIQQHLLEETSLASIESSPEEDADDTMCASPVMVEKMVQRGLDSIRSQADLQSTLITTVFNVVADESEDDDFKLIMGALDEEMSDIDVPQIDFSKKNSGDEASKNMPPKSDKRKTLSYVVDGPLLHQGLAGSIDSFVELISGYNDYVDEFFDYIMSRQGVSVGAATADSISNFMRKVPMPELEKLRQSGILGGRIRSLVEE
eukprot:scaffold13580_cov130-Skeletonema_dohrnii-CCMP3373.AAC.2